jgi:hypothetical protein
MKALLYAMALSLVLFPLAGCETLTDTPGENLARLAHSIDTNGKQIPEDIENDLLYINRPSWLSKKPVPWE